MSFHSHKGRCPDRVPCSLGSPTGRSLRAGDISQGGGHLPGPARRSGAGDSRTGRRAVGGVQRGCGAERGSRSPQRAGGVQRGCGAERGSRSPQGPGRCRCRGRGRGRPPAGPWPPPACPPGQWERRLLAGRAVAALPQQRLSETEPSPSRRSGRAMEGMEGEVAVQTGDLLPCKICGRTFFPAALKKHGPICQKTSAKKRKTFDSSRQRAEGTDIPTVKPLKPRPEPPKKPSNWRRKHEEFIATIRAAKGLNLKDGGKLPPPPPPSYDPDYIQCPYCQRRFNENAADRHINFCKEQAARITNKGKLGADTKGKLPARTQYKPAPVKKMPSVGSTPSPSSRLPQPSGVSKTVVGVSSSKALSSSGSSGSKIQTLSPGHKNSPGAVNPQAGGATKTRTSTPPGVARAMSTGALTNRRKTSNSDIHLRSDGKTGYDNGDCASSVNGGSAKSSEGISPAQLSKFCHECGTKYPVEWAKFCCECGIRRMAV
ncbi:zinc finger C2HC domain-containing protein 1A [Melospiza georgiana]|uniref:zinc finger C2HC domain-containing protein 1A n=1 Tax=Melospiza georgiana TaxID=44398 RepID=UPI0025AB8B96|nr:zinc finger C2HC domain-containing protein 1A [Melospiza georgiana]